LRKNIFTAVASLVVCLAGAGMAAAQPQALYSIDLSVDSLIRTDPNTGAGTLVGPLNLGVNIDTVGADFSCDGTFWAYSHVAGTSTHILYSVDLTTGQGTLVQTFNTAGQAAGVGFEFGPDESSMFWRNETQLRQLDVTSGTTNLVATYNSSSVSLTINPDTCQDFYSVSGDQLNRIFFDGTEIVGPSTIAGVSSLAAAPDGTLYAHANGSLVTLDKTTGAATLIGPIGFVTPGTAFGPQVVTCTASCPFCDPRTQGFWKRQCKGPHPEGPALGPLVDSVNNATTFAAVASTGDICSEVDSFVPPNDKCEQAEAQFMAVLLNRASGRLTGNCCISSGLTPATNVGGAIVEIDGLLSNPGRTFDDCVRAQAIADAINTGAAFCAQ
jgi:hypothetical protein